VTHKRQKIRHAMRGILAAHPDLTGRVFTTRARPVEQAELPVVILYGLEESAERITYQGALQRSLVVAVEIRISSAGFLDDALDNLCALVEALFAMNRNIGGLALDSVLSATSIGLDGEGEARQAIATLRYTVKYSTDPAGN